MPQPGNTLCRAFPDADVSCSAVAPLHWPPKISRGGAAPPVLPPHQRVFAKTPLSVVVEEGPTAGTLTGVQLTAAPLASVSEPVITAPVAGQLTFVAV